MDERAAIAALEKALTRAVENTPATPGCRTIAALKIAAHYAKATEMPGIVAASMLVDFMQGGH